MKTCLLVLLVLGTLVGCRPSSPLTPASSPITDTKDLDKAAESNPQLVDFAKRVKDLYGALQKKDWETTYDMRTSDFKGLVTKQRYLETMASEGKYWDLESYKILNVKTQGEAGRGIDAVQLIVEYHENHTQSYNCAIWKNENGVWLCKDTGCSLSLLTGMTPPNW